MPQASKAFTLIELLVVITIIVVLLALLTSALDKAIQQAELAMCGANQKTIAMGANVYAMSNKRTYPNRKALNANGQPTQLNDPWDGGDDRLLMKDYVPLDAYLDPLCDELDIDPGSTQSQGNSNTAGATNTPAPFVGSGYQLFYSWKYIDSAGHKGLTKAGDRFSWTGTRNVFRTFPAAKTWTFDILVSDQNSMSLTLGGAIASHPDDKGFLSLDTKRNEPYKEGTYIAGVNEGFYFVHSRWGMSSASQRRGAMAVNTARTDGSVSRMNDVAWDDEERVTSAPIDISGPGQYDYWLILPQP